MEILGSLYILRPDQDVLESMALIIARYDNDQPTESARRFLAQANIYIEEQDYIFNYATKYYYNNSVSDLMSFQLSDSDFNDFNSYLKSNNFAFKTKTEDALTKVLDVAKEEELDDDLKAAYNTLISKLNTVKSEAISTNKEQLKTLLENEIIKRYFYREGLYKYFLANNSEVKKASSILTNPREYNGYLKP